MNWLASILRLIVLPREITCFENKYIRKINRIGLIFFWAHLPVFMAIAYFNETGPLEALGLSLLVLAGPTLAYFGIPNPRSVAIIYGMTAMLMGGILVHVGQGPVQIEMHFYFFAQLAMLAVYGNPMVIVAAAATVATHHLLLWVYLPKSVFNYDAPLWVVGVHAAFVVLESVATCSIARSFFDNVIGLDKIVKARTEALAARNRDMRLVMDHVDQALLTVDEAGRVSPEYSRVTEEWLAVPQRDDRFIDLLDKVAPEAAESFELGWEQLQDGLLPLHVCLDQLPKQAQTAKRALSFQYIPISNEDGDATRLLVVATDITARVERERLEAAQSEILRVFQQILRDKHGFLEFFDEAQYLVSAIEGQELEDLTVLKRMLHTLKGNAALFSIQSVADVCHDLESAVAESGHWPTSAELERLQVAWNHLKASLEALLGDRNVRRIEIDDREFEDLLRAVLAGEERTRLAERIAAWRFEPTSLRLQRLARQAEGIAHRLDKTHVKIQIAAGEEQFLEPQRWSRFWQAFVHAIRNALDHGVESEQERRENGKDPRATVLIQTKVSDDAFSVEIADDGRGVDWENVRTKARACGLPVDETSDLKAALFEDGFTTRPSVSQYSGRGIGMAALRQASEALGGRVEVESRRGEGTSVRFIFPRTVMAPSPEELIQGTEAA